MQDLPKLVVELREAARADAIEGARLQAECCTMQQRLADASSTQQADQVRIVQLQQELQAAQEAVRRSETTCHSCHAQVSLAPIYQVKVVLDQSLLR